MAGTGRGAARAAATDRADSLGVVSEHRLESVRTWLLREVRRRAPHLSGPAGPADDDGSAGRAAMRGSGTGSAAAMPAA